MRDPGNEVGSGFKTLHDTHLFKIFRSTSPSRVKPTLISLVRWSTFFSSPILLPGKYLILTVPGSPLFLLLHKHYGCRSFLSWLLPLCQNESLCKTNHENLFYLRIHIQAETNDRKVRRFGDILAPLSRENKLKMRLQE